MKNYKIITKFDDCKTLREILDLINNSFFEKTSYFLLNLWILYPLLMMFITYKFNNDIARSILYSLLIFVGMSGVLIVIIYSLKKFYKKEKINFKKYLPYIIGIILLIWCFITCFFSIDKMLSFTGDLYRKEGLQTYLLYGGILSLAIMLKNKKYIKKLINNLLFVEIIMSIIALLNNSFTHDLMFNQEPYTGIFSQFNHYGYYLMFGVILSIFMYLNSKNKLYLISYILILYTLIINDTFGCFLAVLGTVILILIYYIFIKKQLKILIPIILIFILVSALTFRNNQNVVLKNFYQVFIDSETLLKNDKSKLNEIGTSRGQLWRYGLKYIGERPITGYGIETIQIKYAKDNVPQSRPHNVLIQFGVFTGIPGIILYIAFVRITLVRSISKIKELNKYSIMALFMVICYLMSSMFGNSMFYTSPYYFIFLGILMSNTFYIKKKTN